MHDIERLAGVSFDSIIGKLRKKFPEQQLVGLDEGAGKSTLAAELRAKFGLTVVQTDARPDFFATETHKRVNVVDLVKHFGKGKFHLAVSSFGGVNYSPLQEKALYQLVSVLKQGGIGIVGCKIGPTDLFYLSKKLNITVWEIGKHKFNLYRWNSKIWKSVMQLFSPKDVYLGPIYWFNFTKK